MVSIICLGRSPHQILLKLFFFFFFFCERTSLHQWHNLFGHQAFQVVRWVLSKFFLFQSNKAMCVYSSSQAVKSHSLPFNSSTYVSHYPLDLVFNDFSSPAPILSSNGFRYYVSLLGSSHYLEVDVHSIVLKFQANVECQFERKIEMLQIDWGGEFHELIPHLQNWGITHRISCSHTHQQNGPIERKHRHIICNAQ
jgi:hypothetical protein